MPCCDSRADPAIVFDAEPGDLFVCCNVASLVPPYSDPGTAHHGTPSAIEYAVSVLKAGPCACCSPHEI
jgi:carbonic anhydrase